MGKKILEVGSGGCFLAKQLMGKFPNTDFTLLDMQEMQIKKAKIRTAGLTKRNVSFICEDVRTVRIPARSFDVITCAVVLDFIADPTEYVKVLKNFKKWLSRNGVLIIGNFVGEDNHAIAEMQMKSWLKHIENTFGTERAKQVHEAYHDIFIKNSSILTQVNQLKEIGFKEVEILYKKHCSGVYYAIKN